jgi:glutamyl/glutaminyl-tRNA synthetase
MNGEYIRMMSDAELMKLLYAFDSTIPHNDALMGSIIPLVKERMKTLAEFSSLAGFFFRKPESTEKPLDAELVAAISAALAPVEWNHEAMESAVRSLADTRGAKAKDVFMMLRLAITGKTVGPPLLESLEVMGKESTLARLSQT